MNPSFMRVTSRFLIASMLLGLPLQSAHAGLVATERAAMSAQSQPDRERIRAFLDREDVRHEMLTRGVDGEAAKARVDALTDGEVQKVAGRLDQMPAGGDVVGVLLFIFLVLLVTDILGFTKVFPFTRTIK
ncbi:MAG: PA2779 family protein [Sulfuricella sp.]|nr:PA2779 family protein [Sulfuricella sp.]